MAAIADEEGVHIRMVPLRVMIRCPSTEVPVDTGYEPAAVATIREAQVLANCTECGQDHTWRTEKAFLGP
jgi:hypothetical protein